MSNEDGGFCKNICTRNSFVKHRLCFTDFNLILCTLHSFLISKESGVPFFAIKGFARSPLVQ